MSAAAVEQLLVDSRWRPPRSHLPSYRGPGILTGDEADWRDKLIMVDRLRCEAARDDVNAFIEYAIPDERGQPIQQQWFHEDWHAHLDAHRLGMIKAPRSHGKTTQLVTGRILWRLGRDPSLRIKIVCESDSRAAERLIEIRTHIESNPHVRAVFPDLRPAARHQWTTHKLNVAHAGIHRDASVEALGVLSSATGGRADILVADDIVGRRTGLQMPELRKSTIRAWDSDWMQLLERDGEVWYIGTPWHPQDVTHAIERRGQFAVMSTEIEDPDHPIWIPNWDATALREKLAVIGSVEFARAYQLRATGDDQSIIRSEWIRYFDEEETCA